MLLLLPRVAETPLCDFTAREFSLLPPLLWDSGLRLPCEEDTSVGEGHFSLLSLLSESFPFFSWKFIWKLSLSCKGQYWRW